MTADFEEREEDDEDPNDAEDADQHDAQVAAIDDATQDFHQTADGSAPAAISAESYLAALKDSAKDEPDEADVLIAFENLRAADKSVPDHPLAACHDAYVRIMPEVFERFTGQRYTGKIGRCLKSFATRGALFWNWPTLADPEGPVMQEANTTYTIQTGRDLGFGSDLVRIASDCRLYKLNLRHRLLFSTSRRSNTQ